MDKYSHSYSIILDDMDLVEYRLKPVCAITYFQDAFARYTATKGYAAYDLFPQNKYWVIADLNAKFQDAAPFWSEEVEASVWISEISKLKLYVDFELKSRNKTFLKGDSCWFILDSSTRRPTRVDSLSDAFKVREKYVFLEHKKFALGDFGDEINKIEHKINISEIDFNNHTNNKSYLNLAEASLTKDYRVSHVLDEISIKFCRETFLNDTLSCSTHKSEKEDCFVHIISKQGASVCEIKTSWIKRNIQEKIENYDLNVKS